MGVYVENAGEDFIFLMGLFNGQQGFGAVGDIEAGREFSQAQVGTVVQLHILSLAGVVVHFDVFEIGNKIDLLERLVVIFHVGIALGGSLVIVEGYAGGDNVQHG